ncbi:MAG: ankyrin repeat domain-containing protein [Comamonadaceae bacterium]|nr:MAG: ankyrin repeat domain-containing protein [Comamonadaceae bacterium]
MHSAIARHRPRPPFQPKLPALPELPETTGAAPASLHRRTQPFDAIALIVGRQVPCDRLIATCGRLAKAAGLVLHVIGDGRVSLGLGDLRSLKAVGRCTPVIVSMHGRTARNARGAVRHELEFGEGHFVATHKVARLLRCMGLRSLHFATCKADRAVDRMARDPLLAGRPSLYQLDGERDSLMCIQDEQILDAVRFFCECKGAGRMPSDEEQQLSQFAASVQTVHTIHAAGGGTANVTVHRRPQLESPDSPRLPPTFHPGPGLALPSSPASVGRLLEKLLVHQVGRRNHAGVDALLADDRWRIDPDARIQGRTAMHVAALNNEPSMVERLTAARADPDLPDDGGKSPLLHACLHGLSHSVRVLLDSPGVDAGQGDLHGFTPLMAAASNGHGDIVRQLLSTHAFLAFDVDRQGRSALHWAAAAGHENVVAALLANDLVDVDAQDEPLGRTALMLAIQKGHFQLLPLFRRAGRLGVHVRDHDGLSVVEMLMAQGRNALAVELLLAAAGD